VYRLWGGGESKEGNSRGAFGQLALLLAENRMTMVAFEKEVSFKSLAKRLFDSTEVLNLRKKTCNICKWKEKVQKNTGGRRKVQATKAAFKGLHLFICFLHNGELALF